MSENNHSIESERRLATVMFADISGFTAMSEMLDPEQVTCTMNDCFCMMEGCIKEHGGSVDKFIGDSVMALFGVPKALEEAPQKAVNTAIELRNRLIRFNREKNLSIPLNLHIGINTGPVLAGPVGGSDKQEYTVMGDTVNLASRLEDTSREGQILVGPATYQATNTGFEYRPLDPIVLKGKAEPVPVYELLSVKETLFRVQRGADRMISSVMVGRDSELSRLELAIIKAINGEGSIVNVIGEAGIGKSRLIAELKKSSVMKNVTHVEGRAISIGANLGYHLIIDLLKNWARITEEDSGVAALTKLESSIRFIHPEALGEILPFVATFMGIKLAGRYAERVRGIEGEALAKLILKNVRDLTIKGTEKIPLVVILEDFHWSDTSSIELMESLFRLVQKVKIVFINVFRPGYVETGDRIIRTIKESFPDQYAEITLQSLDEQQTDILITNLLNMAGFPHKLREQIIERAGGNPYFIEEVVRSLIDDGAVVMKDNEFEITDKLSTIRIPRTISEVLMARIDRLDKKTRDLVKTASVIGRTFFHRILAEVAGTIDDIEDRLKYLEEIQLIRERRRMDELEYLFKHALAQEVAYESILVQRRKEMHRSVADTIEKVFNERLHEFYGMLAFHYSQAEDLDKTEDYLIKAGEESLKASASSEALHYYRQALKLYLGKYGDKADPEKIAMLEKNIALALFNRGRYAESVEYFDKVLAFYGETVPGTPVMKALKFWSGFFALLVGIYLPFLKWKKDPTQKDKDIITLYHKKGQALVVTDPHQFFRQMFYFIKHLTKFGLTKIENGPGIMASTSALFSWTGMLFTLSRRVLEFVKDKIDMSDTRSVMYYKLSDLMNNYTVGDWPEEISVDHDLIDRNLSIGEFFFTASYVSWNGLIYTARGNYNAARGMVQKLSDIGETYDNEYARLLKYRTNTYLLMKYRKFHDALSEADAMIQFTGKFYAYSVKARMQIMTGNVSGAADSLAFADGIKSKRIAAPNTLWDFVLNRFILELYRLEEAMKKADRVVSSQHRANALRARKEALKLANKFAPMRTEALKLMGVYYWLIGRQRKAMHWWRTSILEGTRLGDRIELSRTYFEVGKRLLQPKSRYRELDGIKAGEYLEKAQAMFEEMDLKWDLDELEMLKIQMVE